MKFGLRSSIAGIAGSLCLGTIAFGKVTIEKSGPTTIYDVSIDDITFSQTLTNGKTFSTASLKGVEDHEGIVFEPGSPLLPVVRFYVTGDVSVETSQQKIWAQKNQAPLMPAQPSRVKLPVEEPAFVMNRSVYAQKSMMPTQAYTIEDAGSIRGLQQKLVTLYPLSYSPASSTFGLRSHFVVTATETQKPYGDGPETFAFVVADDFAQSPSLAAYEIEKQRQGYETARIIIGSRDTAETVRSKIKDLYNTTNLQHVLIIGDSAFVPSKRASNIDGVTDHYYRAIDTNNYHSDINGPDIGVGRVSVQTEAQLETVLAKFTRYIAGNFTANEWLNGASFLATNDRYDIAERSHNYAINTHTKNHGYMGVFPYANQEGGDKLYAVTHRVRDSRVHEILNMGRGIVTYSGHGATTFWDSPGVSQRNVRALNDENALPFVASFACITGQFTVSESFAETWQRHHAGAIMYWGSMDLTWWNEDDITERRMYDGIFARNKRSFRDITQHALTELWSYYGGQGFSKYYWETFVTFGDPSIELRTTYEEEPAITGPSELPVGVTNASYKVTNDLGEPISGARIAIHATEGLVASAVTNASGEAILDLGPASLNANSFELVVTGQNLVQTSQQLDLVATETF